MTERMTDEEVSDLGEFLWQRCLEGGTETDGKLASCPLWTAFPLSKDLEYAFGPGRQREVWSFISGFDNKNYGQPGGTEDSREHRLYELGQMFRQANDLGEFR